MTQLNTNSIMSVLQEELNKDGDFLKEMVKIIMQQLMEEERDQQVGVLSHQRDNTNRLKEKGVKMAATVAKMVAQNYQQSYTKVSQMLEEELEFTLTYLAYPKHHRHKIRTTNLIEGVINKDPKQRSRVVGVFPNQESCMRYVCMRLMMSV